MRRTPSLAVSETMQFGHVMDRIMHEILLANSAYGPVLMSRYDISDGFCHVDLNVEDISQNLGWLFSSMPGAKPLVAFHCK